MLKKLTPNHVFLLACFAFGTDEFIVMAIISKIADSFQISVAEASSLVTLYALGVAIGAPVVSIATSKLPKKYSLIALLGVFLIGNIACACAPTFSFLQTSRFCTAFAQSSFFGISSIIANHSAGPHEKTQSVSVVFLGLSLANIIGTPLGLLLGAVYSWRTVFLMIMGVGTVALVGLCFVLKNPKPVTHRATHRHAQSSHTVTLAVFFPLTIAFLISIALFLSFGFIEPRLNTYASLSLYDKSIILSCFGVGLSIGSHYGAKLADYMPRHFIPCILIGLILNYYVLSIIELSFLKACLMMFVWGALSFAILTPIQLWVIRQASTSRFAEHVSSILNIGVLNVGNAFGAKVGSMLLEQGLQYSTLPLFSCASIGVATLMFCISLPFQKDE